MAQHLLGKVVIITGAGRGIGRALALQVAAAGAAVVINDLDANLLDELAQSIQSAGGKAMPLAGSVCDWDLGERLTHAAMDTFGRLDGLINNAGLHYERLPWEENEAELRQLVEVNVLGPLFCGIPALRHFIAQRRGSLINVSSSAHLGGPGHASYGATKGAVASLSYGWAMDAKPYGVRVNAVAPLARTRMTDGLSQTSVAGLKIEEADTLAPLFIYLLSDFSTAVSGQLIRCHGQEIGLMRRPAPPLHNQARDPWDVESLAALFSDALAARAMAG